MVAALAFPWFEESTAWADESASLLQRELASNTFPSGVNRELAFDYHGLVAELGLIAGIEADRAGRPLPTRPGGPWAACSMWPPPAWTAGCGPPVKVTATRAAP